MVVIVSRLSVMTMAVPMFVVMVVLMIMTVVVIVDVRMIMRVIRMGVMGMIIPMIVRVMVVPGSARVRLQAEAEGLDKIFTDFGAEWRNAGCSMCLGMNPDQLAPGERCASTSNRNFEGRQGKGGRTHLVSPVVAAATAVRGTLSAPSDVVA